jgi:hypothetical protein
LQLYYYSLIYGFITTAGVLVLTNWLFDDSAVVFAISGVAGEVTDNKEDLCAGRGMS